MKERDEEGGEKRRREREKRSGERNGQDVRR